jgi:hypothetical protein
VTTSPLSRRHSIRLMRQIHSVNRVEKPILRQVPLIDLWRFPTVLKGHGAALMAICSESREQRIKRFLADTTSPGCRGIHHVLASFEFRPRASGRHPRSRLLQPVPSRLRAVGFLRITVLFVGRGRRRTSSGCPSSGPVIRTGTTGLLRSLARFANGRNSNTARCPFWDFGALRHV